MLEPRAPDFGKSYTSFCHFLSLSASPFTSLSLCPHLLNGGPNTPTSDWRIWEPEGQRTCRGDYELPLCSVGQEGAQVPSLGLSSQPIPLGLSPKGRAIIKCGFSDTIIPPQVFFSPPFTFPLCLECPFFCGKALTLCPRTCVLKGKKRNVRSKSCQLGRPEGLRGPGSETALASFLPESTGARGCLLQGAGRERDPWKVRVGWPQSWGTMSSSSEPPELPHFLWVSHTRGFGVRSWGCLDSELMADWWDKCGFYFPEAPACWLHWERGPRR